MYRRDLSKVLVASAAGAALLSERSQAQSCTAPCYALTSAESAAGATVTNLAYPPGNVLRYGADPTGSVDSSAAFASAFKLTGLVSAVGNFRVNSPLTMDISTTSLVGPGSINAGVSSGAVITLMASGGAESNAFHTINGIAFGGQGTAGVQALDLNTSTGSDDLFSIENCTFSNFADGVKVTNNAWEIQFRGCIFGNCGTDHAGLYVHYTSSERISCVQCAFYNSTECVRVDGGGEVFLDNCSLDYSDRLINVVFGTVFCVNCFMENNSDTDYWLQTGVNDATLQLNQCYIAQTGPKTNFAIGSSQSAYGGALSIRNSKIYLNNNSVVNPFIAGSGNAYARDNLIDGFANNVFAWGHFSATSQLCSNGTFSKGANNLGGWAIGSHTGQGGSPTAANNTLKLQVALGGQDQFAYWTINAEPGQNVGFTCDASTNAAVGFGMVIRAVGADGVTIAMTSSLAGLNGFGSGAPLPGGFTQCRCSFLNLPPGTATVQLELNTNGAASPSAIVSVQNVFISKY